MSQSQDETEMTPDDRRSQVALLLAAAILRMRTTPPPISGNLSAPSNTGLELVSESLLTVTRGERSPKRQLTRRIQK